MFTLFEHNAILMAEKICWLVVLTNYYILLPSRMKDALRPSSTVELFSKVDSGHYFVFTSVRHPFDRVLSAFRDRIDNSCSWQAKDTVPRIFLKLGLG